MQKRVGYHDTMESASAGLLAAIQASLASNPVATAFIGAEANVGAPPHSNNQPESSGTVDSAGNVQELLKPKES